MISTRWASSATFHASAPRWQNAPYAASDGMSKSCCTHFGVYLTYNPRDPPHAPRDPVLGPASAPHLWQSACGPQGLRVQRILSKSFSPGDNDDRGVWTDRPCKFLLNVMSSMMEANNRLCIVHSGHGSERSVSFRDVQWAPRRDGYQPICQIHHQESSLWHL